MKTSSIIALLGLAASTSACAVGELGEGSNEEGIIGGTIDNGHPSVVAILAKSARGTSLCTGTVISPTAILTAAHCVDPRVTGAATFEVQTGTSIGTGQKLAVAKTAFNPAWNPNNLAAGGDVAIVKLAQPTTLAPMKYGGLTTSSAIRIVGYGMNIQLNNPALPSGAGTKRVADTRVNSSNAQMVNIGDLLHQTCHGDSGGPAFQVINGVETVVAVTSYGTDMPSVGLVCLNGEGFSARVDASAAWIAANR